MCDDSRIIPFTERTEAKGLIHGHSSNIQTSLIFVILMAEGGLNRKRSTMNTALGLRLKGFPLKDYLLYKYNFWFNELQNFALEAYF